MAYTAYISASYYSDTYNGTAIDSTAFNRLALRASDEIDAMTFNRIRRASSGITGYDAFTQEQIKIATCVMAEALAQIDTATGGTGVVTTSETVNGYRYDIDPASIPQLLYQAKERTRSILMPTGLLYAGI